MQTQSSIMAKFIHILSEKTFVKSTKALAWVITKINGEKVYTITDSPFKVAFENGYISISDIFGRNILINSHQCIDMVQTILTIVETTDKGTQYYNGDFEVHCGYSSSMDTATPLSVENTTKICG